MQHSPRHWLWHHLLAVAPPIICGVTVSQPVQFYIQPKGQFAKVADKHMILRQAG